MEGWGKNGVQTTIVLYPNSCYNAPCCSEVQVYFGIMGQYDPTFDLKINVGLCDLYFVVQ